MRNSVKLYSNGSAVITKVLPVKAGEALKVSIPVKASDLDEVVASLSVAGNVTISEAPTYSPTNSSAATLQLDPTEGLRSLVVKLCGALVKIDLASGEVTKGRLLGVQDYKEWLDGTLSERYRVVVAAPDGIRQIEEAAIVGLSFTDEWVQQEVDKALTASLASVKPDSSAIELELSSDAGTNEAAITYTTPCAAWKIRYQLRVSGVKVVLDGEAIVDNDTDDDWTEVQLSVITGEPISFSTDVAEIRRPHRERVNVVSDAAAGAVSADDTYTDDYRKVAREAPPNVAASLRRASSRMEDDTSALEESPRLRSFEAARPYVPARSPSAEIRESGDFAVYTSPESVTVASRKSAIIRLFSVELGDSSGVLLYKPIENPRRPYRAIKLRNTTAYSLGRGVCEVYVDGERQGKCVLDHTPPGEDALLVHAVENGVRILKECSEVQTRRAALRIAKGVMQWEQMSSVETVYRVRNNRPERSRLEIEHARRWSGATISATTADATVTVADTAAGWRVGVELVPNGQTTIIVRELVSQMKRTDLSAESLEASIVLVGPPLAQDPGIRGIVELKKVVDDLKSQFEVAKDEADTLSAEQDRLIKLLPNVHAEQANRYRNEIAEAESVMKEIRKVKLPALRRQLEEAEGAVQRALAELQVGTVN